MENTETFTPRTVGGPFNPSLYDPEGYGGDLASGSPETPAAPVATDAPSRETQVDVLPPTAASTLEDAIARSASLQGFFSALVNDLENTREGCSELRANKKLGIRYDRNDRRATNRIKLYKDQLGGISESYADGYAPLGLTQGWSAQAITAGASYQGNMYHERSERFFAFRPCGKKRENKRLEVLLTKATEWFLRSGSFERHSRDRFLNNFKHGTTFLRMELTAKLEYVNGPDGKPQETRTQLIPKFRVWPVRDFEASNRERGSAEEQQSIYWINRNVNLASMEGNEATWDYVLAPQGQPVALKRTAGKYFNLGCLRKNLSTPMRRVYNQGDTNSFVASRQADKVSMQPTFDLIEYEGRVSYDTAKQLKPMDAALIGVDVGMGYDWDYADPQLLEEFWMRVCRIPVWQIAYASPQNSQVPTPNLVFQFNPAPFGQSSLYVYRYGEDEGELDGMGVPDYGDAIEAWGDALRNAQVRVDLFNAHPSVVIDKSAIRESSRAAFRKALGMNGMIEKMPGRSIKDFVEFMYLTPNANSETIIQSLREMFFDAVGVLPVILGNASAATLGQDRMNQSTAQNRLDDNLLWNAKEDYRMIRDILTQLFQTLGRDAFFMQLREITGYDAAGVEEEISTVEDLWKQFFIDHPNSFGRDQTVLSRLIDEKSTIYAATGLLDYRKVIPLSFATAGYPYAEDLLTPSADILEPKEEQKQMAVGNEVLPTPQMDPLQLEEHIASHLMAMQQIEQGRPPNLDNMPLQPENTQALYMGLQQYLEKAIILRDMMMMRMGMMQGGGAPGSGGGVGLDGSGAGGGMSGRAGGMMGGMGKGSATEGQTMKNITDSVGKSPAAGLLPYTGI
jgi:hypothetical protein